MLSIGAVKSVAAAATYFERDDYYAKDGEAPSEWFGRAAEDLGLTSSGSGSGGSATSGGAPTDVGGSSPAQHDGDNGHAGPAVDRDAFRQALAGTLPDGTRLGTIRNGELVHRAGWDLTFSAPKSVSIMATIGDDRRLVEAHAAAVRATLAHVEREYATTRLRDAAGEIQEVKTGALAVATFRHETNRNLEPQLHTHAVVLNITIGPDAHARSLEPRPIFVDQKAIGAHYRTHLAALVARLGYDIERDSRDPTLWRIRQVPQHLEAAFSSRAREVEAALAARGLDRATATPKEAEMAAKDTRAAKGEVDRAALLVRWKDAAGPALGDAIAARDRARASAADNPRTVEAERMAARIAVEKAIAILAEREAVFSDRRLAQRAGELALGKATPSLIREAIRDAAHERLILPRIAIEPDRKSRRDIALRGWTTPEAIKTETAMLEAARSGRWSVTPMLRDAAAARYVGEAETAARAHGFEWTPDQRAAAKGLLTVRDRIAALQGYAGTAKTTTVLATYAAAARSRGMDVIALAPTNEAAGVLGRAVGGTARTVDSHLLSLERLPPPRSPQSILARIGALFGNEPPPAAPRQVWVVDESGLAGASKVRDLLEAANARGARVILVGDMRQIGSVEAGCAFGQLQKAQAVETFRLETIVRQCAEDGREAVYAALRRDVPAALTALERGGSTIVTAATAEARTQAIAAAYLAKTPDARAKTVVVDPSREGRDLVNAAIRQGLKAEGTIQAAEVQVHTLRSKGLTTAERSLVESYGIGDVIRFARDHGGSRNDPEFVRDSYHTVVGLDARAGLLTLRCEDGQTRELMPSRLNGRFAAEVLETTDRRISAGDTLRWTRKDDARGIVNGQTATVLALDTTTRQAEVQLRSGERITLDLSKHADRHFDYGYAQTAYTAQGRTEDSVIFHAESWRINLVNASSFYVMISRMREDATVVTDSRDRLADAIATRAGEKQAALEARSWSGLHADLGKSAERAAADPFTLESAAMSATNRTTAAAMTGVGTKSATPDLMTAFEMTGSAGTSAAGRQTSAGKVANDEEGGGRATTPAPSNSATGSRGGGAGGAGSGADKSRSLDDGLDLGM